MDMEGTDNFLKWSSVAMKYCTVAIAMSCGVTGYCLLYDTAFNVEVNITLNDI